MVPFAENQQNPNAVNFEVLQKILIVGSRILLGWLIAQITVSAGFFDHWTTAQLPLGGYQDIAYGNGVFVVVGRDLIGTSPDGFTWRGIPKPENDYPRGVAFGSGRFVMVAEAVGSPSATQRVFTSTDGEHWDSITIGGHELSAVTYAKSMFIAAGWRLVATGNGWEGRASFFRSADGLDWEYQHVDLPGGISSVAFQNGVFVAVGWRNHFSGVIYRSLDGAKWEPANWPVPPSFEGVTAGNGLFVAAGITSKIYTSKDGLSWSEQSCAIPGYFRMAAFLNGTFFVGQMHTPDFAVSADGVHWTAHNFGEELGPVRDLVFTQGRFVGVTYLGQAVLSQDITSPVLSLGINTNGIRIQVAAEVAKSSTLSESENLLDWSPFTSLTNTSTLFEIDRPADGNASFFKLQIQSAK